jgi:hypothetical protein
MSRLSSALVQVQSDINASLYYTLLYIIKKFVILAPRCHQLICHAHEIRHFTARPKPGDFVRIDLIRKEDSHKKLLSLEEILPIQFRMSSFLS